MRRCVKQAGAGEYGKLGAQVKLMEHESSYIACFVCMLNLHPGCDS